MIWLVFAVVTLAVVGGLLYPLLRKRAQPDAGRVEYDVVVYRDQLKEIDQEIDRGVLTPEQADAARSEVHRRMLAAEDADDKARAKPARTDGRWTRIAAIVAIGVILPVGAVLFYGMLGSPNLPDRPYDAQLKNSPDFITLTDANALAQELRKKPTSDGYDRLAGLYFAARDYPHAVEAARKAIDLGATGAPTWSELGESEVMASGGDVSPEALMAFTNALGADKRSERSRFYIGLAEAQIGNLKHAVAIWRDLEKDSDASAPWLPMLREHIAAYSKQGGFEPTSIEPAPPSVEAMKASIAAMRQVMQGGGMGGGMGGGAPAAGQGGAPALKTN